MQIQSLKDNLNLTSKYAGKNKVSTSFEYAKINHVLKRDVFEKNSSISFGSSENSFTDDIVDFINSIVEKSIQQCLQEKHDLEYKLDILVSVSNRHRHDLTKYKGKEDAIEFLTACLGDSNENLDDVSLVFKRNNIDKISDFTGFLESYYSVKNPTAIFLGQIEEAIDIYNLLDNKEDLGHSPELLLDMYIDMSFDDKLSQDEIKERLNQYAKTLRNFDIKDKRALQERFSAIAPYFNNFETTFDTFLALDYMSDTYEDRIEAFKKFQKNHPECQIKNIEKTYANFGKYIDFAFETDEENLEGLQKYYSYMIKSHKVSSTAILPYAKLFNNFKDVDDKINFWIFLAENNIDYSELADFAKPPIVDGITASDAIKEKGKIFKNYLLEKYSQGQAQNYYKNNFKILISLDKHNEKDEFDIVSLYLDLSKKYNLKSFGDFLKFYNSLTNSKVKTLTAQEIYDFVKLFRYEMPQEQSKNIESLKSRQSCYTNFAQPIENYLNADESDFYMGMTSLDVFLKYYDKFAQQNPSQVEKILEEISKQDNIKEKEEIEKELSSFSRYFEDKTEIIKFIKDNNIQLAKDTRDDNYINAIHKILTTLEEISPGQKSFKKSLNALTVNGIFSNPVKLTSFLNRKDIELNLNQIIKILVQKNIASIEEFEDFINSHSNKKSDHAHIIEHVLNSPEKMDFEAYKAYMDEFEQKAKYLRKNAKITNDNILKIKLENIDEDIASFFDLPTGHPLDALKMTYMRKPLSANKYDIADELIGATEHFDPAISNLFSVLKLNEKSIISQKDKVGKNMCLEALSKQIPDELIELLEYFNHVLDGKTPTISIHAQLKMLARFILTDNTPIDKIDMQKAKQDIYNLLNEIYNKLPQDYCKREKEDRIYFTYVIAGKEVECLFSTIGRMITIYPKDEYFFDRIINND